VPAFAATRIDIIARRAKLEQRGRTGPMTGKTEITVDGLVKTMMVYDSEEPVRRDRLIKRYKVGRLIKLCLRPKTFPLALWRNENLPDGAPLNRTFAMQPPRSSV